MPNKCCVPRCRSNYLNGPRVSVFSFPNDAELRQKWLKVIHREDFTPTRHTRVCEKHFRESEVERIVSMYDEKKGKLITAPLSYPRLIAGAIPSRLLGCPKYLSQAPSSPCECPEAEQIRLKSESLENALQDSIVIFETYDESHVFNNIQEFKSEFNSSNLPADWTIIERDTYVQIVLITGTSPPKMECAVHISEELMLSAYLGDDEIYSLSSVTLPKKVNDVNVVEDIINEINRTFFENQMVFEVQVVKVIELKPS